MNRKILTISIAVHVAVAAGLGYIQVQNAHKTAVVELIDVKKPKPEQEKKPPPEPPKPKVEPPKQQRPRSLPRSSNTAQPAAAARATGGFEGVPDFGLALSGNGQGIAVAVAAPEPIAPAPPQTKTLSAPAPKRTNGCASELQKPVPISVPKPEYPVSLRGAAGNGRVRIKLTVDENGQVISAEILSGMADEFNQAALAAARRARFEPGTQCGNPVVASFTIAMRFSSG